jgi:hypothetical protein
MKCECCASEMKWVGSMITGSLVCPHCSCCEEPENKLTAHGMSLVDKGVLDFDGENYYCNCPVCDERYELPCDVSEVNEDSYFHCGGSPRCCP